MRQNFEYNLRVLANFGVKTKKPFQKTTIFFLFLNKDYTFYTKKVFSTMKDAQGI